VITEWRRFLELNLDELRDAMRPRQGGRILIDGRNLFDPAEMQRLGFRYRGIGRGAQRRNGLRERAQLSTVAHVRAHK
jgi:UDPglucose 6-dehydrogenase